uniref:Uncharacterized protein n=1 Tax=Anopheles culicifacies TaxID=139723 RepID=A0A182M1B7_9DIPT
MQRSNRLLVVLLVVSCAATCYCDDVVPVTSTEDADETVTTEPSEQPFQECWCASANCPNVSSDGQGIANCNQCCAEEQLTTVLDVDEATTQQSEFTTSKFSTTTTAATTTTTTTVMPSARTHGRMVRFGGRRRMARPTTVEPQRTPTVNSRTLLNRRGLFNPELRNRYLGRFRSTTTTEPDNN